MSCERNAKALADVAAGAAPPAGLRAHLEACSGCRAALAELREALALADGALDALAAADPSPELPVRIRQAAAAADADGAVRRWSAARWVLAGGCAALVVTVVVAGWERSGSVRGPRTAPTTPQSSAPAATTPPSAGSAGPVSASGQSAPLGEHRGQRPARRAEPEVLVPAGQEQELRRLVALAHDPKVDLAVLAAVGQSLDDLADPADLAIKPLEIAPLDPAEAPGTY